MNNDSTKSIIEHLLDDEKCKKYLVSPFKPYQHTTYRVDNLISYMQLVNTIGTIIREEEKYLDFEICYRGMEDCTWKLEPSVQFNHLLSKEKEMYGEFLQLHPMEFDNIKSSLDKLAKMQHYGLPTRLLDFTKNPLVALFFACNNSDKKNRDKDARVVVYITDDINNEVGEIICESFIENSQNIELCDFDKKITIVKPSYITQRERIQQSLFMIFNNRLSNNNYSETIAKIDDIEKSLFESNFISIIIDSDSKAKILHELNNIGINIMTLFPELEYTGKYLKETYKNRVDMELNEMEKYITYYGEIGNINEKEVYVALKNDILGEDK